MSDPIDIKALDEYLKGGSDVAARYREIGGEEVPPDLDRRVLETARAAVANQGAKRSRSWLRWSAPVALAASVVLAVTVVIERGVQNDELVVPQASEAPREQAPASYADTVLQSQPAAPPPPASRAKAEASAPNSERATEEVIVGGGRLGGLTETPAPVTVVTSNDELARREPDSAVLKRADSPIAAQSVQSAANDAAEADYSEIDEVAVTGSHTRRAAGRTAGPRSTIPAGAFRSEARQSDAPAEHSDPEKWLEEIRGLRRDGKAAEADREWQSFRATFPDYSVADDDIARSKLPQP